jgi:transcriptional regulator with XRE-family HTH domain
MKIEKDVRDLSRYKEILKGFKISHQDVAEFTGRTRETVTLWLNGRHFPPLMVALHISEEIEELIENKYDELIQLPRS